MKRFLAAVITAISILSICVFMAACSSADVSGKSYRLTSYEFDTSSFTVEDFDLLNVSVHKLNSTFGNYIAFDADGNFISDTISTKYEQSGNKIKIDGYRMEVSGSELRFTKSFEGFSFGNLNITAVYAEM